ncbi:TPA: DUF945 domain-containing protein [Salmonella enterica]|nr:DUF945 domain-containing protein [Salmonella enterica]
MRLASRFGRHNSIRRKRPLTDAELMQTVPSAFSGDKHESRSERYTYIPTINIINRLREEGFQPFFACQSRVRDLSRWEYSKHMLRLRREGLINWKEVPEIILLNSHDGSSSYQMVPGLFRFVCTNGLACGNHFGEIRVPHKGDNVWQVIEGAYEVMGIFAKVTENMESIITPKGTPADIRGEGNLDGLEKPEGSSATLMLNVLLHNFQRRTSARASKV